MNSLIKDFLFKYLNFIYIILQYIKESLIFDIFSDHFIFCIDFSIMHKIKVFEKFVYYQLLNPY
ncbi:hypothetical protein AOE57_00880 [Candidatus Riesia pediculicola]|nr:hypothetical protein AOE57_00880 [Candidatus Riesia pediculicola]